MLFAVSCHGRHLHALGTTFSRCMEHAMRWFEWVEGVQSTRPESIKSALIKVREGSWFCLKVIKHAVSEVILV